MKEFEEQASDQERARVNQKAVHKLNQVCTGDKEKCKDYLT